MALVSVNQPVKEREEKEESAIDKILKGLQIVGAGSQIYANIKEIGLKDAQTTAAQKANEIQLAEKGFQSAQPSGLTPEQKTQLTPEVGPHVLLPGLSPNRPNQPMNIGGSLFTSEKGRADALTLTNQLKKEYQDSSQLATFNQAELNHANAIRGLQQGGKEGQLLALNSIRALYQPGNTKAADGSNIANADSAWESLGKKIEEFRTGKKQVLDSGEVNNLSKLTAGAMAFYAKQAQKKGEEISFTASRMGLPVEDIGIKQIDSAVYEEVKPTKQHSKKLAPPTMEDGLKAEMKRRGMSKGLPK